LSDQVAVVKPALFRRGRDQLTVGAATKLLWITPAIRRAIHKFHGAEGATKLPWAGATNLPCVGRDQVTVATFGIVPELLFVRNRCISPSIKEFRGVSGDTGASNLPRVNESISDT